MNSKTELDEQLGREKGGELLMFVARGLKKDAEQGQLNTIVAKSMGSLALVTDFPLIQKTAETLLREAPQEPLLAGGITNIPASERLRRKHELPTRESIEEHEFPSYDRGSVLNRMRSFSEPHIQLVIDGQLTQAIGHVETPLQMEEFACACSVIGNIDDAVAYIGGNKFPAERQGGPLVVACIESFQRGRNEEALTLLDQICESKLCQHFERLSLASGFLGRVPWQGYPFPDY